VSRWIFPALLLLCAAPICTGDLLPLLDWPEHLAIASILRHYGDPAWHFHETFEIDPRPLPYGLFHALTALCGLVLPIPVAGRVVLLLYVAGTPLALREVLRAFGRDERLAWFAVPLVYNRLFFMGFVPFLLGVTFWLLAVGATERWFASTPPPPALRATSPASGGGMNAGTSPPPPLRGTSPASGGGMNPTSPAAGGVKAGLLAVLGYFAHGYAALAILGSVVVLALAHRPPARKLLAFVPFTALFAWWVGTIVVHTDANLAQDVEVPWQRNEIHWLWPSDALARIPDHLFEVHAGAFDDTIAVLLIGLVAVLVALRRGPLDRFDLLAALVGLSYFVAPYGYGVNLYMSPRNLLLFAFVAVAFAGATPFAGARRWLLVPIGVLSALLPAWHVATFLEFQRDAGDMKALAQRAGPGRTLGLIYENGKGEPWAEGVYHHFASWFQVYVGGDVSPSFVGFPNVPVRYRPGQRPPQPVEWQPETFRPEIHLPFYDHLLVRGEVPDDVGTVVLEDGEWSLVETER
jgi:hypothetical protein